MNITGSDNLDRGSNNILVVDDLLDNLRLLTNLLKEKTTLQVNTDRTKGEVKNQSMRSS